MCLLSPGDRGIPPVISLTHWETRGDLGAEGEGEGSDDGHLPDIEQWSQSSGSNVIRRRTRPDLPGLRPHIPLLQSDAGRGRTLARRGRGRVGSFQILIDASTMSQLIRVSCARESARVSE